MSKLDNNDAMTTAIDDCCPVEKVEIYVDGELVDMKTNFKTETGYVLSGIFEWRRCEWGNGNHTVSLRACDTLGKTRLSLPRSSGDHQVRLTIL